MPPIILHSNWNQRPSDFEKTVEPLRKYFFICEGANTESFYFKKLISIKKEIGIHSLIDLVFIEKTEEDKDISYPQKLVKFAKNERDKLIELGKFEKNRDFMIITFDLDIFKNKVKNLDELLIQQDEHLIFGIAYPSFELFLLLHIDNSLNDIILPNKSIIITNEKIGSQRPCQVFLREATGKNSKTNDKIGDLAYHIDTAIYQEKLINQQTSKCLEEVTSNIALIIEKIKNEKFPF